MYFFKSKFGKAYSIESEYSSKHIDTNSNAIRNHPILHDSKRERQRGERESGERERALSPLSLSALYLSTFSLSALSYLSLRTLLSLSHSWSHGGKDAYSENFIQFWLVLHCQDSPCPWSQTLESWMTGSSWHEEWHVGCLLKVYYVTSIFWCQFQASRSL